MRKKKRRRKNNNNNNNNNKKNKKKLAYQNPLVSVCFQQNLAANPAPLFINI